MTNAWDTSVWPDEDDEDTIRRRQIEEVMRADRPRYFRDEAMQQEYRDILGRQKTQQPTRERNLSAPGVEVSAPVERGADGNQNPGSRDPADLLSLRMADNKRINGPRIVSDVTPDNDWAPGTQYAGWKLPPELEHIYEKGGRKYYREKGHRAQRESPIITTACPRASGDPALL